MLEHSTVLRIVLFAGLVFHKLVWEILKRRNGNPGTRRPQKLTPLTRAIKTIKVLILLCLIVQTLSLDLFPIAEDSQAIRIVGVVVFFLGLIIAVTARMQIGKNWIDLEDFQVLPDQSLVTNGIYRHIRHPIYTGDLLLVLGLQLALNSWLVLPFFLLIPIVYRQAAAEEVLLAKAFPDYAAYSARTRRFVPFVV